MSIAVIGGSSGSGRGSEKCGKEQRTSALFFDALELSNVETSEEVSQPHTQT
jgi:hypothetical protein